jgi:hypothetical protein
MPAVETVAVAETSPGGVEPSRSIKRRVGHTLSGWRQLGRIAYRDPEHVAERLTLYIAPETLARPLWSGRTQFARRAPRSRAR